MITWLRIENYKGFRDLLIPELSRITLLGGSNNVGKTSLLEAMFLFYDRANPNVFFRQFAWRGVTSIAGVPENTWGPIFREYLMERKITISVRQSTHSESMEIVFDPSYSQKSIEVLSQSQAETIPQVKTDQQPILSYALKITYKSDGKKEQKTSLILRYRSDGINVSLEPETYIDVKEGAIFLAARGRIDPNEDATRYGLLDVHGNQNVILEALKIIEPRLRGLSSVTMGQVSLIHGDIGIGRKLPIAFMGDGLDRLLSIIMAIATCKNGVVFIDEIENGIHHSAMANVWEAIGKVAKQFNCQVVATTHSYECLQAAHVGISKAKLSDEFSYIRLDRVDEEIVPKPYTLDILGAALERGWEVR